MKTTIKSYDTWSEFVNEIRCMRTDWHSTTSTRLESKGGDWFATENYEQAVNLALYGWPEGRDLMTTVADELRGVEINVESVRKELRDVCGMVPIVPVALAGDPANMLNIEDVEVPSKILRVVVAVGDTASTSAETIMRRGGAILSYIDALENAGWRCELVGRWRSISMNGKKLFQADVTMKAAHEPLDIDRAAFAFAHPSMLRRLMFRMMESFPELESDFNIGYGAGYDAEVTDADIWVGRKVGQKSTPQASVDAIGHAIKEQFGEKLISAA